MAGRGQAGGLTGPMRSASPVLLIALAFILWAQPALAWRELEPGLAVETFAVPGQADPPREVVVLRADPAQFVLRLLCAGEQGTGTLTVEQWAEGHGLVAAINASMYLQDRRTSTGYLRNFAYLNNGRINKGFGAILVFNPAEAGLEPVRLLDRREDPDWEVKLAKYHCAVQNYRMVSGGRNVWLRQDEATSIACLGLDERGRVLLIHARAPFTAFELGNFLLSLPIGLRGAMYVEGGVEAGLFVHSRDFVGRFAGTFDAGFLHGGSTSFRPLPNVIGLARRK